MNSLVDAFCGAAVAISEAFWENGGKNIHDVMPGREYDPYPQAACDQAYAVALSALNGAYNYPDPVLFKPTLTTGEFTFRPTIQGALSYFIGTDCILKSASPEYYFPPGNNDGSEFKEYGFALANYEPGMMGFADCQWEPDSYVEGKNIGVAQGKVTFFRNEGGIPTTVDKTFSFGVDDDGIDGAVIEGHQDEVNGDDYFIRLGTQVVVMTGHHSSVEVTEEESTQFVFRSGLF